MNLRNILAFAILSGSVAFTNLTAISHAQQAPPVVQAAAVNQYQVGATLFMQKAAEYRALAYQAFNLAHWQLDADLDKKNFKKLPKADQKRPRAVVVDIDETVLDNSPSQAYAIKNQIPFNLKDWYAWGEMRKAKAIPGSVEFLNYAHSRGVKVFYISNRDEVQKEATIDNLIKAGFKDVSGENVLLRISESSKEARRKHILEKYRIVLLIGDNLDDLSNVFERKSIADRFAEVDRIRDCWGAKFIVLPNAMYGTWESAIYEYERLTDTQKAVRRAAALELP
ncbi:MAG: 5'-nucleotidase, lipoprotein e(P4) family [Pyrinomonadaceae bacterium]